MSEKSFFGRLAQKIEDVILMRPAVDESLIDELEEVLISSDIGMNTTEKISDELRRRIREDRLSDPGQLKSAIVEIIRDIMDKGERISLCGEVPLFVMFIGVNGVGKTTSIAKIAHKLRSEGKSVLLVAADTFRAAAAEQLSVWAERLGVPVVKHSEGADPSSVIYDGIASAKAKQIDVVLCDTAGRLHNKKNLMDELAKMNKVISREYPQAKRETLLVLDATTGKNAVSQTKEFNDVADLTGIILTKLDGTAKGGIAVTIADEYDMPVKYIGVGESMDDLRAFDPEEFSENIFKG